MKIILLLLLFFSIKCFAVENSNTIVELKNGLLLIRLQIREQNIQALKERGQFELANEIAAEQKQINSDIINAFKNEFTFCKVYFFYSNFSLDLKEGNLQKVTFFDSNFEDVKLELNKDVKYFIGEFTLIEKYNEKDKGKETYSTSLGFEALIIKDKNFIQLKKPFPYYVRTFSSLFRPIKRTKSETVRKMNNDLISYYKLHS